MFFVFCLSSLPAVSDGHFLSKTWFPKTHRFTTHRFRDLGFWMQGRAIHLLSMGSYGGSCAKHIVIYNVFRLFSILRFKHWHSPKQPEESWIFATYNFTLVKLRFLEQEHAINMLSLGSLALSWGSLGQPWGSLGLSWVSLGVLLGSLRASWDSIGVLSRPLGTLLALLGCLGDENLARSEPGLGSLRNLWNRHLPHTGAPF